MELREHPQRRQVVGEMHLRRWPQLKAPAQVLQFLRIISVTDRVGEMAAVRSLPAGARLDPTDNPNHQSGRLSSEVIFTWERHSEASALTLFVNKGYSSEALAQALTWAADKPGEIIRATRIHLVANNRAASALVSRLSLVATDMVCCGIGKTARIWSDFRIGPDGLGTVVIAANGTGPGDLSRLIQRLQELGNYRNLALLGLPVAQGHWRELDRIEGALRDLAVGVARTEISDDALLEGVSALSLDLMSISAGSSYRMSATAAYAQLARERLDELAVIPIAGFPSLGDFNARRLLPAVRTCSSHSRRCDELSSRAARFAALLRTRIETRIEAQNAQLLRSMEKSASLQLRLQQLVEGLSVLALTYYAVGLAAYMLKAFDGRITAFHVADAIALLVPAILLGTWWALRQMKRRMVGDGNS
jgi:uncharacterized membrane-anchored protein